MKTDMFEKIKDFLNSEEGKKSMEDFDQQLSNERKHNDRWVEKFKIHCENNLDDTIVKLVTKYDSDEYVNREYKKGYMPRETLLWLVYGYATKYCPPCEDEKYLNMFTDEAYYIGSYVIQVMNGQGSVIRIDKIKE